MLYYLETLRGIAAMTVVLYHYKTSSPLFLNPFVENGYMLVDFFFVLSGFVIALNYQGKINNVAEGWAFQVRRFWRLYPLHFATLMLYVGIETAKYVFERKTGIISNHPAFAQNNFEAFLHNVFFTGPMGFLSGPTFNGPSWTIAVEFWTYAIFALCLIVARRHLVAVIAGLSLLSLAIIAAYENSFYVSIFRCLYAFGLGVLCYNLTRHWKVELAPWLGVVALVASVVGVCYTNEYLQLRYILPVVFAVLIFALVQSRQGNPVVWLLNRKWLVIWGTLSYSLYMIHLPVWWFVNQTLRFGLGVPTHTDRYGHTMPDLAPWQATGVTLVAIGITFVASLLAYRFIEQRYRRGGIFKRIRAKKLQNA